MMFLSERKTIRRNFSRKQSKPSISLLKAMKNIPLPLLLRMETLFKDHLERLLRSILMQTIAWTHHFNAVHAERVLRKHSHKNQFPR
ncbi:Oidioi.mRNA.OKI2018_I69.XSR.g13862.t1.cds [Oikopleura dioica]|uniref:Oidioi.mRNA.OKI2018_I69.XSR.g13862.t1.cds n=1 Tax=Oikopleura dioica TaxID=34765 RepID=A0ABN7S8K4_OIKDI|nr:Oidioi.mRNA.OKI2018_I69.XSR.g13862.t1.cds [Oikopleura dioica]